MLRPTQILAFIAICAPAVGLLFAVDDREVRYEIYSSALAGLGCLVATIWLVPKISPYLLRRGLAGKDLGKKGSDAGDKPIPSALGLACGAVFMVFIIVTQLVTVKGDLERVGSYNAAILSVCFMVLLGFADDVLDLPWRYKLILPTVASLPLLVTYSGVTTVLLPRPVRPMLWSGTVAQFTWLGELVNGIGLVALDPAARGAILDLGVLYYVYMGLLAVFATNAVNIYAGINGLEAGQSLVIAVAILTANLLELASGATATSAHLFSALLALPFIGTTLGVLTFNAYPARVFVGDTYCYFAGMTFAVMGILGHFSKTLLLFFLPQIFNFVYSLPQLFKLYECPRHRMPDFDAATNTLRPSTFTVRRVGPNGQVTETRRDNLTLINLILRVLGPMHERTTVNVLLGLQVVSCVFGLAVRYQLSALLYEGLHLPHAPLKPT